MLFLYAISCAVVAYVLTRLLNSWALRPWRKAVNEHWTERARLLYPARVGARIDTFVMAMLALMFGIVFFRQPFSLDVAFAICAVVGTTLASYFFTKEIFPELVFRKWLKETLGSKVVLLVWVGAVVWAITAMPDHFSGKLWVSFSLYVVFLLGLNCGGAILLFKLVGLITPAPDSLDQMVRRVVQRMGGRVRKTWLWHTLIANAMAFPVTGDLIFSTRLLETLSIEEQESVCAHELGHLTESKAVVAFRILGTLMLAPVVLIIPVIRTYGLMGLAGLSLFLVVSIRLVRVMGRKMEVRADAVATEDSTGVVYARALEHIYRVNQVPAVMPGKRQLHPHLYDRLLAAGITPDYPRPKPAGKFSLPTACLLALVALSLAMVVVFYTIYQG